MLRDGLVTRVLAVLLVAAALAVAALAVSPAQPQPGTAFYLLNEDGVAADYPSSLSVGESATVRIGITNHRRAPRTFRVDATLGNRTVDGYRVEVGSGETVERNVSFTPQRTGQLRFRARLFEGGDDTPTKTLRLWVTVEAADTGSPEPSDGDAQRVQPDARPLLEQGEQSLVGRLHRPQHHQ